MRAIEGSGALLRGAGGAASFEYERHREEHALSHAREPGQIMARTEVRHKAFEVLMDSRRGPDWLASP